MIPEQNITDIRFIEGVEEVSYPSLTWKIDFELARMRGYVDELDALVQSIYKELNTERYDYIIYDDNYGLQLKDLYGKPKNYCYVVLTNRITECLLINNKITGVNNFKYNRAESKGDILAISFTVESVYGTIEIEEVFNIGRI